MQETQVDQLIKAGYVFLFMVEWIEGGDIKVAFAELHLKSTGYFLTIESFCVKKSTN